MKISDLLRFDEVMRWHISFVTKPQNDASHSWNVAVLCMEFLNRMPAIADSERLDVITYALMHDVHEIFDGDIPSNVKDRLNREPEKYINIAPSYKRTKTIVGTFDIMEAAVYYYSFGHSRNRSEVMLYLNERLERRLTGVRNELGYQAYSVAKGIYEECIGVQNAN